MAGTSLLERRVSLPVAAVLITAMIAVHELWEGRRDPGNRP